MKTSKSNSIAVFAALGSTGLAGRPLAGVPGACVVVGGVGVVGMAAAGPLKTCRREDVDPQRGAL